MKDYYDFFEIRKLGKLGRSRYPELVFRDRDPIIKRYKRRWKRAVTYWGEIRSRTKPNDLDHSKRVYRFYRVMNNRKPWKTITNRNMLDHYRSILQ